MLTVTGFFRLCSGCNTISTKSLINSFKIRATHLSPVFFPCNPPVHEHDFWQIVSWSYTSHRLMFFVVNTTENKAYLILSYLIIRWLSTIVCREKNADLQITPCENDSSCNVIMFKCMCSVIARPLPNKIIHGRCQLYCPDATRCPTYELFQLWLLGREVVTTYNRNILIYIKVQHLIISRFTHWDWQPSHDLWCPSHKWI